MRRRGRRPLLAGLAVVVVLAALAALVWWGPLLVVREVEVSSDPAGPALTAAERTQVLDAARAPTGRPLAQVPTGDLADRVRDVPFVAGVRVTRGWPSTLQVLVTHRAPAAALPASGGRFELVDGAGTAYATVARAPKGVPVVRVDLVRAGAPSLQAALAVLDGMPASLRSQVSAVSAQSPSDVRLRVRGKQVVWGSADRTPARRRCSRC
ncbi:hypothetical protein GCM10025868_06630 [Angustibacter aerolatus]|uniref:POTRA domain-containing protein n=1 Tax=Angustibacter aerolatus TaxID=1162965 RepID=A0ABQ6JD99_9ACTN|nr:FtsQ-type POTRA domain-containing protein [Angustibacter aerolatus]GMA85413.1 hypothetical protein GCM10025868_06630 [Angustibacter aerolatus]